MAFAQNSSRSSAAADLGGFGGAGGSVGVVKVASSGGAVRRWIRRIRIFLAF